MPKKYRVFAVILIAIIVLATIANVGVNYGLFSQTDKAVVIHIGPRTADATTTPDYIVDGVADDVQAQAALNALPSGGGKLVFEVFNYNFAATVSRAINNITIEGMGIGSHFARDGVNPLFSAGAQTGWVFQDISTDAGSITMGTSGLWKNVKINTTAYGLRSFGAESVYIADASKLYFGDSGEDTIEHDGSQSLAINRNPVANALKEVVFYSNIAYNAPAQAPLWTINQLGTGECAVRITHSDDTGTKNWLMGQLGRTAGNAVHRDLYIWEDGQKVAIQIYYATDATAGRVRIGTTFWDTVAPGARLEIKGSNDEIQQLIIANSAQTNVVWKITASNSTLLTSIDNNGLLYLNRPDDGFTTISFKNSSSATQWDIYKYGSGGSDAFAIGRPGVIEPFKILTNGDVIMNALPAADPHLAGALYYLSSDNVVRRSGG